MQGARAKAKQKNARRPSKKMQDGRAEVKQKNARVKCKAFEQKNERHKFNKKCKIAEKKIKDGREKKLL
jgi:hypothetical protein